MATKSVLRFLTCLTFILLFNTYILGAQELGAQLYLKAFLSKLEQEYDIKFSYADELVAERKIKLPNSKELPAILNEIESQTQLHIQKLSERYYALSLHEHLEICGTVLDNFEQNTVNGATVEVLSTEMNKVTDANGYFHFKEVPKNAVLRISYLGYKNLIISAAELTNRQPCKKLLLSQFYQQLDEVVVYEFLTKGIIKQSDGSYQLNSEEFGVLPGLIEPDVLQTVQALPGIESIDETVSDINIRGGSNDQNLILWDGIKMYQSGHFFGLISAFNPYLTDQVTLIKNGTSSRYGDGVSGIIDIRTKDEVSEDYYGGAGFNLIGGDVYGHVPVSEQTAFQFSARRSITDFINTPTYDRFFTRAFDENEVSQDGNFYFYDFTGKLMYDLNENHKFRGSFIKINNFLEYSETDMDSGEKTQSSLDQNNLSFGGSYEGKWSKRFSSNLSGYYTKYQLGAQNITSNAQQVLFQNNEVEEFSARLNTSYQANDHTQWNNGYQYTETGIGNATDVSQPPYQSNVSNVVRSHALFTESVFESENRKVFLRAGLRANFLQNPNSFEEFILEPRLSFNYAFTRELKIQALGEFKSQATNQVLDLEQNFLGIEKRRWIVSDGVNLPITKSKQGSIGLNYDSEYFYVGMEGFYKKVSGISTATQGFQNQNQFNGEIGEYDVKGVEFLVNKKTDIYSVWASYTYNLNNYRFSELTPSNFPNNLDIRHTATLAGTYSIDHLKLGIGLNYRTGRPFTAPDEENPIDSTFFPHRINYQNANSSRLPEYLRADISAIYSFEISSRFKLPLGYQY